MIQPLTKAERDRLRQLVEQYRSAHATTPRETLALLDAADALDELKAENERLRAALIEVQRFARPTRRSGFALDIVRRIVNDVLPPIRAALNTEAKNG